MNRPLLQAMVDRAMVSGTLLDPVDVSTALHPRVTPELHEFLCAVYDIDPATQERTTALGFDPMAA